MTTNEKHAARLRHLRGYIRGDEIKASILAGAEALEGQGRWYHYTMLDQHYMIPVEHWIEWDARLHLLPPDDSAFPDWAVPVPDDVVITGVELP